ncbi:NAD-dependent epimerase/dehydratase family protein [Sphingomonas sp. Tas61C01]|uniref:NAD-dependent epimerase/dehydratase family protein n=1 Tax=Sphingomonas sp. Tas61C01 TaxID=3458297 RepID=UPI00403E3EAC
MILAITGGTGFVGGHLIDLALAAGHEVRALTRRAQVARAGVTWVEGSLASPGSLAVGADAIIHVAGIVNAPDRAGFAAGNVEGTRAILAAASEAGVCRFVHVSSLSAREPQLSDYGWSKREAERLVEASALDWTIVRPTAIYGAGDMEMRDLFRAARLGLAFLPPPGLMSAVEVGDLARLLLILAARPGAGETYEIDDGRAWTHAEFAHALGTAVGRPVLAMHLPKPLMRLGARLDRLIRGDKAKLTPDRVGYLCHPDWSAAPDRRPPADLWTPLVDTEAGLAATARWYRANGLL